MIRSNKKLSLAAIIFDTVNYALTLNNTQLKEIIEIVKSTRIIYPKKKVLVWFVVWWKRGDNKISGEKWIPSGILSSAAFSSSSPDIVDS